MSRFAAVVVAGLIGVGMVAGPSQAADVNVLTSCKLLLVKFPNGVAKDAKSQALTVAQGQVKPVVNKKVYDLNFKRLDRHPDEFRTVGSKL